VECEIIGPIMEWNMVGRNNEEGDMYEERARSCEVKERFGVEVGVRISLCKISYSSK